MGVIAAPQGLQAIACPTGFFGVQDTRYGSQLAVCIACPTYQTTSCSGVPDNASCIANLSKYQVAYNSGSTVTAFNSRACVHMPGYAWVASVWAQDEHGSTSGSFLSSGKCPDGWFASGGNNSTCISCPANLMTGMEGAVSQDACGKQAHTAQNRRCNCG